MDRFSISLNKKPSPLPEESAPRALLEIDPDLPPKGTPYRVITHELDNTEMDHSMYMEAIRTAAEFSCSAGSIGDTLYSVRLISNVATEKFEIRLVFTRRQGCLKSTT